jgi:hypothetical protein
LKNQHGLSFQTFKTSFDVIKCSIKVWRWVIFNKIGLFHLGASFLPYPHHHLILADRDPHQPLRSMQNCPLAFAATMRHHQTSNGNRPLQQEEMTNNINKTGITKTINAKKKTLNLNI